jgi:hypothetical protein
MQVIISSDSELSVFGWIMVVTAFLFVVFVLIMFVSAVASYLTRAFEEADNFIEEEINTNYRKP